MSGRMTVMLERGRVRLLLMFGRERQALAWVLHHLDAHPSDAFSLATGAHLHASLGDPTAAQHLLERLVRLHPERVDGWFNLGYVCESLGLLAASEAAFRRAIAIDPRLDRAWYGLSLSLIAQQRLDEALQTLRKNTELQPMSPYGWYQMARVQVDRQAPDEAEKIIHHLRGFEPRVAAQLERETGLGAVRA
jgi:tetratricopeptide (TPR) repeat protein